MTWLLHWLKPPAIEAARAGDGDEPWLGAEAMVAPGWLRELDDDASRGAPAGGGEADWCAL